jgi:hypothetical protein
MGPTHGTSTNARVPNRDCLTTPDSGHGPRTTASLFQQNPRFETPHNSRGSAYVDSLPVVVCRQVAQRSALECLQGGGRGFESLSAHFVATQGLPHSFTAKTLQVSGTPLS